MTAVDERVRAERTTDRDSGSRTYTYPPTGDQLVSVTTVLSDTQGRPWLSGWAARLAAEYAIDHRDLLDALVSTEGRAAAVTLAKDQARQIRDLKADAGSYVHSVVEALILWAASPEGTGSSLALPALPDHLEGADYDDMPLGDVCDWMIEGFLNFCADFRPEFLASEMAVYHKSLGVAGTLDIILRLHGYGIAAAGRLMASLGFTDICCDVKTGRHLDVTMREQIAAYRRMQECLLPMGELAPMPPTDAGAVLQLRPEFERGYRLMLVSRENDARAWNTFRRAVEVYRDRAAARAKPGRVVYPLREDGTMPQPRLADLDGEGYGRAISALVKAGIPDLEKLAAMTPGDLLAVKGIGGKSLDTVRVMLADHGLSLNGDLTEEVA